MSVSPAVGYLCGKGIDCRRSSWVWETGILIGIKLENANILFFRVPQAKSDFIGTRFFHKA
jgi:hypothetical protein